MHGSNPTDRPRRRWLTIAGVPNPGSCHGECRDNLLRQSLNPPCGGHCSRSESPVSVFCFADDVSTKTMASPVAIPRARWPKPSRTSDHQSLFHLPHSKEGFRDPGYLPPTGPTASCCSCWRLSNNLMGRHQPDGFATVELASRTLSGAACRTLDRRLPEEPRATYSLSISANFAIYEHTNVFPKPRLGAATDCRVEWSAPLREPTNRASSAQGLALYREDCSDCHGDRSPSQLLPQPD